MKVVRSDQIAMSGDCRGRAWIDGNSGGRARGRHVLMWAGACDHRASRRPLLRIFEETRKEQYVQLLAMNDGKEEPKLE
uniref:Uncharacterized protein n=1 Tax=Oryza sativa subsp. japonica TaxID=39947 RepID=Q69J04_ORYSJ|nr:hypothetical protein [Oryza sativa Japonica Group]BAD34398.1 hypothetical protein [Oryza sativa Japonica Group]